MNASNAKDYLPLAQALAEGKTIQVRILRNGALAEWVDHEPPDFIFTADRYRIKPEPKKQIYRVGLFKYDEGIFFTYSIDKIMNFDVYETYETKPTFVRWLTDRIEYELPEGDA